MDKYHILHYTFGLPPKATGGLPLYVRDLSDAQKDAGYKVSILLPKQKLHGKDKISRKGKIYYLENSLPVSSIFGIKEPKDYIRFYNKSVIENFLNELQPTIIHIHSFMGLPKEFLEVAKSKGIKLVYTTHDYYGLCLKCNFINSLGTVCTKTDPKKCAKCNFSNGLSTKMSYAISTDLYKIVKKNRIIHQLKSKYRDNKVREGLTSNIAKIEINSDQVNSYAQLLKYYESMFSMIDMFHFNSELTKDVYVSYLSNIEGKVIPITLSSIKDHRNERNRIPGKILKIGYIGRKEPYKGIDLLIDSLTRLHEDNIDFSCLLYGDDFSKYDLLLDGKVKNMGIYKKDEIQSVFDSIDILVVPSICKETFGFVVLEALSFNVPVLVSDNVGSKDIISNDKYIFSVNNSNGLYNSLLDVIKNNNYLIEFNKKVMINSDLLNIYSHVEKMIKFYNQK